MKPLTIVLTAATLLLTSCGLTQETWLNAVRGHQELPALSVAILECTADRPDVQEALREPFNELSDAWIESRDLELNKELLHQLADAMPKVLRAESNWIEAKQVMAASGLDCGPWVKSSVENIESAFTEIKSALIAKERLVLALDYAQVFAAIFASHKIEVVRIPE